MGAVQSSPLVVTGLRGRDGYSTHQDQIPPWRAAEMLNVELFRTGFAKKRGGTSDVYADTTGESLSTSVHALGVFVPPPAANLQNAELWAVDNVGTVQRLPGTSAWGSPTVNDAIAGSFVDIVFCAFKGKLYICYDSAVDRLHAWDPTDAQVRRTGLATPVAPTVGNTGAGTYAATPRYYKVRYVKKSGSTYLLASEVSANVSFTPSGGGTAARVTKPAAINEGETHWQLYASADNNLYFQIAETVVGTTTYDDSATPSAYAGEAPPLVGTHANWTSVKYLIATDDHLIGAGAWETGGYYSRVWWSAVTNQTGIGDAESVIQTTDVSNYVDLGEDDGDTVTGIGGPLNGRVIVFKRHQIWALIPTGQDNPFYKPEPLYQGSGVGCVRHHTIAMGEDEAGRPALYWLADAGPYRLGANGLQFLGDDGMDIWDSANYDGAGGSGPHGLWYPRRKQVWWWIATTVGATNTSTKMVFNARLGKPYEAGSVRDGTVKHSISASSGAFCSCLYLDIIRLTNAPLIVRPHIGIGFPGSVGIQRCDTSATDDAGASFQAYVDLPTRHLAGLGRKCSVGQPAILGTVGSQTLRVTLTPEYDATRARTGDVTMTAVGSETRTTRVVEGVEYADVDTVQIRIGDASANTSTWTIDALVVPFEVREQVTA